MKKKILIAVGILVVIVLIGAVVVYSNLDKIVRVATEKVMSYVLQVDVTVASAKVNLGQGSIEFHDIVIPNPPGYSTSRAMKFGLVKAQVDIPSFRTDQPAIKLVQVSQAEITMEVNKSGSNLQDLVNNASRLSQGKEEQPKQEKPKPKEAGKQFKIDKVLVDGTTVRVGIPFMGGKTFDVPLPTIEMNNLGGKNKGTVTPAEAMQEFLAGILGGIKKAGTDILPTEVLANISTTLKNLPGNVKEQIGNVTNQLGTTAKENLSGAKGQVESTVKQAGQEAGKAAGQVKEGLQGLFGGKKETPTDQKK